MSSRAMAARYSGSGGMKFPQSDPNSPSLLSSIFGQDAITGGSDIDPTNGQDMFTPYQGSSGVFGGQSRRLATLLNAQRSQQQLGIQGDKELQQMLNDHNKEMENLRTQHVKDLASLKNVQDIASKYGVTPEQYAQGISDQVTSNQLKRQILEGNSLDTSDAQKSSNTGVNFGLSGINPNMPRTASSGGVSAFPMPTGGMGSVFGANPTQEQNIITNPVTGMPMVTTRQAYQKGGISLPIDAMQYDQASKVPPPSNISDPANTDLWSGGVGHFGTGVDPNPGQNQSMAPTPANSQNDMGNPKNFYTPEEQNSSFAQWYNSLMQQLGQAGGQMGGQGFRPQSLIGAF